MTTEARRSQADVRFKPRAAGGNHEPDFLWCNAEKIALPNKIMPVGGDGAGEKAKLPATASARA